MSKLKFKAVQLKNGELLRQAEEAGYELQQWPDVRLYLERIVTAVNAATPGSYTEVEIPHKVYSWS